MKAWVKGPTWGKRLVLAAIVLAVAAGAGLAWYLWPRQFFGDGNVDVAIEETLILKKVPGMVEDSIRFAKDGKRYAYTIERNARKLVVIDGVEGAEYDEAGEWTEDMSSAEISARKLTPVRGDPECRIHCHIQFSLDGSNVAYIAKRGGRQFVVVDGVGGREYEEVGYAPWFCRSSDDGMDTERLVWFSNGGVDVSYFARRGTKWFMVSDGVEGREHDEILEVRTDYQERRPPYFVGRRGDKQVAVIDGIEGNEYDETGRYGLRLRFSNDLVHFAYPARSGDKWFVVADGKEGKRYDDVEGITLGESGEHLAYVAREDGDWFVVRDGTEGPRCKGLRVYEWDRALEPSLYAVEKDGKWRIVAGRVEGKPYDEVGRPTWDAERKRMAYIAKSDNREFVVIDGVEGKPYDDMGMLYFSSDGRRFYYIATVGKRYCAVIDGVEGEAYDAIEGFKFSHNGKRYAYFARLGGNECLVADGARGPLFRYVDFFNAFFSKDGAHFVYTATSSNDRLVRFAESINRYLGHELLSMARKENEHVVVDGVTSRRYDSVSHVTVTADCKHLAYLVGRGDKRLLVVDEKVMRERPKWDSVSYPHADEPDCIRYTTEKPDGYYLVTIRIADRKAGK